MVRLRYGLPLLHWHADSVCIYYRIGGWIVSLTDREKLFCKEYLIDLRPRAAAKRAGYRHWRTEGPELLESPAIKEYVGELMAAREERLQYTADDVLRRLLEIDQLDIADIMADDGTLLPIVEWPRAWRTVISGFEVAELKSSTDVAGFLKKIKLPDKLKVIEMIGRHLGVSAFRENVNQTVNLSGIDALHAARVQK